MMNLASWLLAQDMPPSSNGVEFNASVSGPAAIAVMLGALVFALVMFVSSWKIHTKAGQPGWAMFIPIYNAVVFLKIAGKPAWWLLLLLIPGVNALAALLVWMAVAERFGKGGGFGLGLVLLPIIFVPMLAFSDAKWTPAPATA